MLTNTLNHFKGVSQREIADLWDSEHGPGKIHPDF